jgi:hypothetical protein
MGMRRLTLKVNELTELLEVNQKTFLAFFHFFSQKMSFFDLRKLGVILTPGKFFDDPK